ncbi:hypothetical protein NUW58_g2816 [Xylaria curta]|uniref:Uncharacterized protein n=1 Tax=Xylaria curta TaxID=42375 RepID=A0ACC1PFJ2_9PEZI|nr:hypothetical protein NUW58_g2816 [Xylaria curta]
MAIADMKREDSEYQAFAGKNLEEAVVPSVVPTPVATVKEDETSSNVDDVDLMEDDNSPTDQTDAHKCGPASKCIIALLEDLWLCSKGFAPSLSRYSPKSSTVLTRREKKSDAPRGGEMRPQDANTVHMVKNRFSRKLARLSKEPPSCNQGTWAFRQNAGNSFVLPISEVSQILGVQDTNDNDSEITYGNRMNAKCRRSSG